MNCKKLVSKSDTSAILVGAVVLTTTLAVCIGYEDGPRAGAYAFAAQDDRRDDIHGK